jgi:hypothetical protein
MKHARVVRSHQSAPKPLDATVRFDRVGLAVALSPVRVRDLTLRCNPLTLTLRGRPSRP